MARPSSVYPVLVAVFRGPAAHRQLPVLGLRQPPEQVPQRQQGVEVEARQRVVPGARPPVLEAGEDVVHRLEQHPLLQPQRVDQLDEGHVGQGELAERRRAGQPLPEHPLPCSLWPVELLPWPLVRAPAPGPVGHVEPQERPGQIAALAADVGAGDPVHDLGLAQLARHGRLRRDGGDGPDRIRSGLDELLETPAQPPERVRAVPLRAVGAGHPRPNELVELVEPHPVGDVVDEGPEDLVVARRRVGGDQGHGGLRYLRQDRIQNGDGEGLRVRGGFAAAPPRRLDGEGLRPAAAEHEVRLEVQPPPHAMGQGRLSEGLLAGRVLEA